MNAEICRRIIDFFEHVRERPVMYTGRSSDYARMINFIQGFYSALEITQLGAPNIEDIKNGYLEREWNEVYFGAVEQMKSKGFDGDDITRELLSVEIDLWKKHCMQVD